jgi:hypothetical protein
VAVDVRQNWLYVKQTSCKMQNIMVVWQHVYSIDLTDQSVFERFSCHRRDGRGRNLLPYYRLQILAEVFILNYISYIYWNAVGPKQLPASHV